MEKGRIKAFKGVHYNASRYGNDWSKLTCPPYDVIDDNQRDRFLAEDQHNFVGLTLKFPHSCPIEQRDYKAVRQQIQMWLSDGVLVRDAHSHIYAYSQTYEYRGRERQRIGFLALLRLPDEKGWVLPHERTHSGPKADRLRLLEEVEAELEPIFLLIPDDMSLYGFLEGSIREGEPLAFAKDGVGEHKVFALDASAEGVVNEIVGQKRFFIADGHHRFEVAMKYRDIMRQRPDYDSMAWYNYMLVFFAPITEENILIRPIFRRVMSFPLSSAGEIKNKAETFFVVSEIDRSDICKALGAIARYEYIINTNFGVFSVRLKDIKMALEYLKGLDASDDYKQLPLVVLHNLLFELLGIDTKEGGITYTAEEGEAMGKPGVGQAYVLMRPTAMDEAYQVALNDERMPQKSTFFYPKIRSGFVFFDKDGV